MTVLTALLTLIACGDLTLEPQRPIEAYDPWTPPGIQQTLSVSVNPDTLRITAGDTVQLQATVKAADGSVISAKVIWSAENADVATVSADGMVKAVAFGITKVVAEIEGTADKAVVVVPVQEAELPPTTVQPTVSQTWNYGNTSEMLADPKIFNTTGNKSVAGVKLNTAQSLVVNGKTYTNAMQAHFFGASGTEHSAGVDWHFPDTSREVWIETYLKFDPNWTTSWPNDVQTTDAIVTDWTTGALSSNAGDELEFFDASGVKKMEGFVTKVARNGDGSYDVSFQTDWTYGGANNTVTSMRNKRTGARVAISRILDMYTGSADHKTYFIGSAANGRAFEFHIGLWENLNTWWVHDLEGKRRPSDLHYFGSKEDWTGEWIQYRMHIISPNVNEPGLVEYWRNGVLKGTYSFTGAKDHGVISRMSFGRNVNAGVEQESSVYYGPTFLYTQNPGW